MKRVCFIFDIDGTVADGTHRRKFIQNPDGTPMPSREKNWPAYKALAHLDTPVMATAAFFAAVTQVKPGPDAVFVTGRGEDERAVTEKSRLRSVNKVLSVKSGVIYDVRYAHVTCSEKTRLARIAERADKVIDQRILDKQMEYYDPPQGDHVFQVNEDNFDQKLVEVVQWINSQPT